MRERGGGGGWEENDYAEVQFKPGENYDNQPCGINKKIIEAKSHLFRYRQILKVLGTCPTHII